MERDAKMRKYEARQDQAGDYGIKAKERREKMRWSELDV